MKTINERIENKEDVVSWCNVRCRGYQTFVYDFNMQDISFYRCLGCGATKGVSYLKNNRLPEGDENGV